MVITAFGNRAGVIQAPYFCGISRCKIDAFGIAITAIKAACLAFEQGALASCREFGLGRLTLIIAAMLSPPVLTGRYQSIPEYCQPA